MRRRFLIPIAALFLVTLPLTGAAALAFEAATLGYGQAWTGNAYVPPQFEVTGSEAMPIDGFARMGARLSLVEGFIVERAVLSVHPALGIGLRYYLLYASGRVVPTQIETATGWDGELGLGAARFLTLRLQLPLAFEYRLAGGAALLLGVSPTTVFRIRAGHVEKQSEDTDLSGFGTYFYGSLRFLMPELTLAARFGVSDYLDSTVHATWGVSILDLTDPVLPSWHEMRVEIGMTIGLKPTIEGLFRSRRERQPLEDTRAEPAPAP